MNTLQKALKASPYNLTTLAAKLGYSVRSVKYNIDMKQRPKPERMARIAGLLELSEQQMAEVAWVFTYGPRGVALIEVLDD